MFASINYNNLTLIAISNLNWQKLLLHHLHELQYTDEPTRMHVRQVTTISVSVNFCLTESMIQLQKWTDYQWIT